LAQEIKNRPSGLKGIYWGQAYSKNSVEISQIM